MSVKRMEEIKAMLQQQGKVMVNDLSQQFQVSTVSIRKDLAALEKQGLAKRFYGGAQKVERLKNNQLPSPDFYQDQTRLALAEKACEEIEEGDCIFLGSGRTCCILARKLDRFNRLTVVTNNITALQDLLHRVSKVYLIGGEVTSTDEITLFSSWEQPQKFTESIYVNKAFTSISGIDVKAGLTVNSVISTYVFRHIPTMAHQWILMADHTKYDRIAIYPVAEISQVHTVISDNFPSSYADYFQHHQVRMVLTDPK